MPRLSKFGDIRELEARTLEHSLAMQKFAAKKMPGVFILRPGVPVCNIHTDLYMIKHVFDSVPLTGIGCP